MNKVEFIAAVRHLGWVAFQVAAGQPYNVEINDDQRDSLLDGVKFALAHPGRTPEQNHENWMKMKIAQGWKYGPEKDFEKKTHPDLVSYDELPEIEQRKDLMDKIAHDEAVRLWDEIGKGWA